MKALDHTAGPAYDAAVADLLGAMACAELLAFERLAHDATLAPTLEDKAEVSQLGLNSHFGRQVCVSPPHSKISMTRSLAMATGYWLRGGRYASTY